MKTRIFECCTKLGLATVAAVLDRIEAEDSRPAYNLLLLSVNTQSQYPELDEAWADPSEHERRLLARFSRVDRLDRLIAPEHPLRWRFHPSWLGHGRVWRSALGVEHVDELVLESIQVPPGFSLASFFSEAQVRVYSDGLMVYSPTRILLSRDLARRISDVYYAQFLPPVVTPLLLQEARPRYTPLALSALASAFPEPSATGPAASAPVLFLGQALSSAEIMSLEEEVALYLGALLRLNDLTSGSVAFKPHPSAPASLARLVASQFRRATGTELTLERGGGALEDLLARGKARAVVGVFSTGLFTARGLYGVPAFSWGARSCYAGLSPFENSNRIPVLAADLLLPRLEDLRDRAGFDAACRASSGPDEVDIERFRKAQLVVGYHMQREILWQRRTEAEGLADPQLHPELSFYLEGAGAISHMSAPRRALVQGIHAAADKLLDPGKAVKLRRSPERFFADSKLPGARALSRLHGSLTRRK